MSLDGYDFPNGLSLEVKDGKINFHCPTSIAISYEEWGALGNYVKDEQFVEERRKAIEKFKETLRIEGFPFDQFEPEIEYDRAHGARFVGVRILMKQGDFTGSLLFRCDAKDLKTLPSLPLLTSGEIHHKHWKHISYWYLDSNSKLWDGECRSSWGDLFNEAKDDPVALAQLKDAKARYVDSTPKQIHIQVCHEDYQMLYDDLEEFLERYRCEVDPKMCGQVW